MQKLLLLLSFSMFFLGFSQYKSIEIYGTLSDQIGKVVNAHIINKTSKQGTFSDDNGNFSIKASLNDKIEITSIQHHTEERIIANITLKTKELIVMLHLKDYLLEEVTIKKTNLTGLLIADSKNTQKSDREKVMTNLGFNPHAKKIPQIDRKIHTATSSAGLIPLDFIINTFTGRIKNLKKEKKLLENEHTLKTIENLHGKLIIQQLGIDSIDISRFIYFSHFDKNFMKAYNDNDLKLIEFLQQQAILFKKQKKYSLEKN